MSQNKIKLISIAGPTASGKTALSVELATRFGGEIISSDSMQIYKDMNIATAKPSSDEMRGIVHHLMDFVEPGDIYSVAQYVADAKFAIDDITSRGKLPILVGGTGLYIDSLLKGIEFSEGEVDLDLRKKLQQELSLVGIDTMLSKLSEFDPESALRLATERNPKRIVRAMEVYYTTGVTMTEQNRRSKLSGSAYDPTKIAITFRDRQKLYDRINKRVDIMMDQGLLKETEKFLSSSLGDTSKQAIGYKELKPYFDGEKSLDECIEKLKQSTRRYAKRQLTWFMRDDSIKWFYVDDYKDTDELITAVCCYLTEEGFDFA